MLVIKDQSPVSYKEFLVNSTILTAGFVAVLVFTLGISVLSCAAIVIANLAFIHFYFFKAFKNRWPSPHLYVHSDSADHIQLDDTSVSYDRITLSSLFPNIALVGGALAVVFWHVLHLEFLFWAFPMIALQAAGISMRFIPFRRFYRLNTQELSDLSTDDLYLALNQIQMGFFRSDSQLALQMEIEKEVVLRAYRTAEGVKIPGGKPVRIEKYGNNQFKCEMDGQTLETIGPVEKHFRLNGRGLFLVMLKGETLTDDALISFVETV